jgi:hypothetical protein
MTSDTPDQDDMKQKLEEALESAHPEEHASEDLFDTDALGNEPAEEDDSGDV